MTTPVADTRSPSEQDILYNGTYNLGFIALRRSAESMRLLAWWEERCLELGFSEGRTGLFVDQKWIDLAPGLFADIAILRDAGLNMAYWNLHERNLLGAQPPYRVLSPVSGEVPLRFFHYSGIVLSDPASLSRNTDRYTLADRPDLHPLFTAYSMTVNSNRNPSTDTLLYGLDTLSDGTAVTRLARRLYAAHQPRWSGQDPFDARGPFARFAHRLRLTAGKQIAAKSTWREFNPGDRRVGAVHQLLRLSLRVLGPNRYELLMRYLAYIAVLRNQKVFLDDFPKKR